MGKVFYSAAEPRHSSPQHRSRSLVLSDSEADTDIENPAPRPKNTHKRSESEEPVGLKSGSNSPNQDTFEESAPTNQFKRLRRPGNAIVRQRQTSRELRDATGQRPLQKACSRGDVEKVLELLQERPDLQDRDYAGTTALHSAALLGNKQIVKALLDAGAVPDVRSGPEELDTPLMDAAANGYLSVVKLLLDAGADPRIDNAIGHRAIDFAMDESNSGSSGGGSNVSKRRKYSRSGEKDSENEQSTAIVRELLFRTRVLRRSGAPIVDSPQHPLAHPSLFPPGFTTVQRSPPPIFLDVLRRSVRAEVVEHAAMGDLPYVGLALERGWHPTAQALVNAAKYGHSEVVGLLLAFGMDANAEFEGSTALQQAIERDHLACVRLLADSGAIIRRSYAQYVSDLPKDNELRNIVVGTMNIPTMGQRSVDDTEEPVAASAPPKMDLRAIKPKKRTKSAVLDGHGDVKDSRKHRDSTDYLKAHHTDHQRDLQKESQKDHHIHQNNEQKDHLKDHLKDSTENLKSQQDDYVEANQREQRVKEENTPTIKTPVEPVVDDPITKDEYTESSTASATTAPQAPAESPIESPAISPSNSGPGSSAVWAERSQELSQLAERKEKERRDREAKMLENLRRQGENTKPESETESAVHSASASPSPTGQRNSSPVPEQRLHSLDGDIPADVTRKASSPSLPAETMASVSVANLPWAVRQLAYTGAPVSVEPIYTYNIGDVPHCIDLQAALALGEPHLQQKYTHLSNHVISPAQKATLWSFCQPWVCRGGASAAEIVKDKARFMDIGLCWVPVAAIEEIYQQLGRKAPRFVPIQLDLTPKNSSMPLTVAPNCSNRDLPLLWQFKVSSATF